MITLAVYGPVTHIARSLSGGGLVKTLTVRELAEGYSHDPPTDFGRIRDTSLATCQASYPDVDWPSKVHRRNWDDQTCTEFLVLVTLRAMQKASLAETQDNQWWLTDKALNVIEHGGSLLQAISGNVFTYTEDEPEPEPVKEPEKVLLPDRKHGGGTVRSNPDKITWSVSYTKEPKTLRRSWATLDFEALVDKVSKQIGCHDKQDFLDRAVEHYLQSVLMNRAGCEVGGNIKDEILAMLRKVKKSREIPK